MNDRERDAAPSWRPDVDAVDPTYGAYRAAAPPAPAHPTSNPSMPRGSSPYGAGAAAWHEVPDISSMPPAPGSMGSDGAARRRPRWFWPTIIAASAVVAIAGGGAGGYAIGRAIPQGGGTSQQQQFTPGQFPNGGSGPNGGTGPGSNGGTGTFGGQGSSSGTGT